ncbi:MAG: DUF1499 domain-containing protein [Roseicyclus sp.]
MRLFVIIPVALAVAATVALAVYARSYQMRPEVWHVDPGEGPEPTGRNVFVLRGEAAPRLAGSPTEVAARLDAAARAEGARPIAGDYESGFVTYVARSRLFGFPDAISIRLHGEGEATRVDILSRSAMGESDFGVNEARVRRWIAAAEADAAS